MHKNISRTNFHISVCAHTHVKCVFNLFQIFILFIYYIFFFLRLQPTAIRRNVCKIFVYIQLTEKTGTNNKKRFKIEIYYKIGTFLFKEKKNRIIAHT